HLHDDLNELLLAEGGLVAVRWLPPVSGGKHVDDIIHHRVRNVENKLCHDPSYVNRKTTTFSVPLLVVMVVPALLCSTTSTVSFIALAVSHVCTLFAVSPVHDTAAKSPKMEP